MEPGHEDREYADDSANAAMDSSASMEPGHEDREYLWPKVIEYCSNDVPQWSPVMKTGNTGRHKPPPHTERGLNGARS